MEKLKNNKVYLYAYIISFIIIGIVISFFILNNKKVENNDNKENINKQNELVNENKLLNSGQYKDVIDSIEKKGSGSLERVEKMKLVFSYLSYGNYFYKEAENSKSAMDILNTLDEDYEVLYYKGYANEIIKNYTGALEFYNKGLELEGLTEINQSLLLNQIGHLYDLKGDFDKVYSYYNKAVKLDPNNFMAITNIGRYYNRLKRYDEAYKYFEKALNLTTNLPLKSEIYFTLSSLEYEIGGLKPDIDKSIDYARQSIEYYPSYPMGYVALARGLYMKNDATNYIEIEKNLNKSIELNPNGYYAYDIYALLEYDKGNYEKSDDYFRNAVSAIEKDMILMDSERANEINIIYFKSHILGEINKFKNSKDNTFTFLNNIKPILAGKSFLRQQLQRPLYGILGFLSDDKRFKVLIEELSK